MKKAWIIASAAVAGSIGLVLLLPYFIDVNQHRGAIQSELEKRLHRKVTLGAMGLRLIPLSIRVDDVSIAEDPAFASQAPFLTAKHIDVHVGILALLRKQVAVDSLHLRAPSVELIRNADGRWNYASLGSGSGSSGSGGSLELANLELEDGRIAVTDLQAHKPRAAYDHIDVTLRDFRPGRRFAIDVAVHLPGAGKQLVLLQGTGGPWEPEGRAASNFQGQIKLQEASLASLLSFLNAGANNALDLVVSASLDYAIHSEGAALTGSIQAAKIEITRKEWKQPVRTANLRIDLMPDSIRSQPFFVESGGTRVQTSFSLAHYTTPDATLSAELKTEGAEVGELLRLATAYGVTATEGVTGSGQASLDLRAQGPVHKLEALNCSGSGSIRNVSLNLPSFTKPLAIPTANLHFEQNRMTMDNLSASLGGTTLHGSLTLHNFGQPEAQFTADIDQFNAGEWKQLLKAAGPETSKSKAASHPLARVTGSGTVSIGKLVYDNLALNKLRANCALDHGLIRLEPVTAELYGGQESGSITVDLRPEQPTYAVRMKMDHVDANQLLSATTSLKQLLYGLLAANGDASFIERPGEDIARTLNGKVNFNLVNGKLTGVNLLNEVATVGRFIGYTPRGGAFTNIMQLTGNFRMQNGVANTDDLKLQFDGGALTAAGIIGLADQTLNLHLTAVLPKQISDQAGGSQIGGFMSTALANTKGELVMPLIATGTFSKPRIAPDAQEFAKLKMQSLLPSATGILGGLGQGKSGGVQGVLDSLQGKKGAPGDAQKSPADSLLDLFKKKK